MKLKLSLMSLVFACLLIPHFAGATTVFETTGWIIGTEGAGFTYDFVADTSPLTYTATLSDLSQTPFFKLNDVFLSITTSTGIVETTTGTDAFIFGPGSFTFEATEGETYFANIFGTGGGDLKAGLFGIEVKAVPIPSSLILLGSSALGLVLLRRRKR